IRTSGDFEPYQAESFGTVGKCEKSSIHGLWDGCTVENGGRGGGAGVVRQLFPTQTDGLSASRVRELADWYVDQAEAKRDGIRLDQEDIDAGLRLVLREEAQAGSEDIEFERVMCRVWGR